MRITPGGNRVIFDASFSGLELISEDVVCDFIDIFFRYDDPDAKWVIRNETGKVDFHAQHMYNPNTKEHTITFCRKNIERSYYKKNRRDFGGNLKIPGIDIRTAVAMTLTHELQHANQSKMHKGNELFYGYLGGFNARGKPRMKNYRGRACERDAREFVDGHLNEIFAYFNLPPPRRNKEPVPEDPDELVKVADNLCECKEVSMEDVRDELRASSILNPQNVQRMLEILRRRGVTFMQVQG